MAKSRNHRRGQVAMEYLATYGWAIFAIFVVVAFLMGSGVLNPSRLMGEECTFIPNLACGSYYLIRGGAGQETTLGFNLTNNLGYPIFIRDCSFKVVNGPSVENKNAPAICAGAGRNGFLPSGATATYETGFPSGEKLAANQMRRVYVGLTWRNCQDLDALECPKAIYDEQYPWHNVSGRMQLYVRGT